MTGDLGAPVVVDAEALSPEERKKFHDGWELHKISQYVSDMVSTHRRLPDPRGKE